MKSIRDIYKIGVGPSSSHTMGPERADKTICPIPWEPDCRVPLKFDINAATAADFYALNGLTFHQCRQLEIHRDAIGGFHTMEEFRQYLSKLRTSR